MLIPNGTLPGHGREQCSRCFDGPTEWGRTCRQFDGWNLINNPMSWGSANPVNLVLGFSKGSRQANEVRTLSHDDVAFRGFRDKLADALRLLGLLDDSEQFEQLICKEERDWAFGSLARCTVEKFDERTGKFLKSGDVIAAASKNSALDWFRNCSEIHLRVLPTRLRHVVLLSNDDAYVDACFSLVRNLHPGTVRINDVAYRTGLMTWVHIVHVGGPGINHIKSWQSGASNKQGDKMRMACAALAVCK